MYRIPLLLLLITTIADPATALAQTPPPQAPSVPVLVTQGSGTLKRAPDQAWVSIAAEARAATPADAQRQAAEAMTAVQTALRNAKLPADAIRTTGYTLQPDFQYEGGRTRIRGYIARNQIDVRVDDLYRLGPAIDAAGASGATSLGHCENTCRTFACIDGAAAHTRRTACVISVTASSGDSPGTVRRSTSTRHWSG